MGPEFIVSIRHNWLFIAIIDQFNLDQKSQVKKFSRFCALFVATLVPQRNQVMEIQARAFTDLELEC